MATFGSVKREKIKKIMFITISQQMTYNEMTYHLDKLTYGTSQQMTYHEAPPMARGADSALIMRGGRSNPTRVLVLAALAGVAALACVTLLLQVQSRHAPTPSFLSPRGQETAGRETVSVSRAGVCPTRVAWSTS